ncbi:hypothetical protein [Novosphingobium sp. FKTRR1]|uniref:hypothetical protein n=1 Tax=Novosphingobium sp. FKTRR1 TaxID=2879118 RepID=UPI001CF01064|nr:hypothetical protein [Novosphingobium sp. FKTRR1]
MPIVGKQLGTVALRDNGDGTPLVPLADNDPQGMAYSYVTLNVTPAASPTDILTIGGSATKLVKVRQVLLSGSATAATNILPTLVRRSTANTGGTATTPSFLPRDTGDPAATAALKLWSVNPVALGTLVGQIDGGRLNLAPAANGGIDRLLFQFGWLNDKPIVLRGVNDFVCLNLGGAAIANTPLLDISIMITEE